MAVAASSAGYDPFVFMIPAAMCASCAFMLPVVTAPNAIAFGTGGISIKEMVQEGTVLSFIISCVVAMVCFILLI